MECGTTNGHKYIYFNLGLVQKKKKKTSKNKLTQHSCSVHVTDGRGGQACRCSLIKPVSVGPAVGLTRYIITACRTNTDTTTNDGTELAAALKLASIIIYSFTT